MIKKITVKLNAILSRFSKAIIWAVAIIFIILIVIQSIIAGGVFWLNGEKGQVFIKGQINQIAVETNYIITYDDLSYAFLRGLRIDNLIVKQNDSIILNLDTAILKPNIFGVAMRNVGVSMAVDTLTLYQIPKPNAVPQSDGKGENLLNPFSLPDIYFNRFGIDDLTIKNLLIKESVMGTEMEFSPTLSSQISINQTIDLQLKLRPRNKTIAWMPEFISINGSLDPQTLDVDLSKMVIENDAVSIVAKGHGNLSNQGRIDLNTILKVDDFYPFTNELEGKAAIVANISGTLNALALQADGKLSMPVLNDNDIDDILFSITDDNLSNAPMGTAKIDTNYKNNPISLSAIFDLKDNVFFLQSINGTAPDLTTNGDIQINIDTLLATGKVQVNTSRISTYAQMFGVDIGGDAKITITLADKNKLQGVNAIATIRNGQYQDIKIANADISTVITDIKNPWPDNVNLNATNIRVNDDLNITSLKSNLVPNGANAHLLSLNMNGKSLQSFSVNGQAILQGLKKSQFDADDINMKLSSLGSSINLTGNADLETLDVKIKTQKFSLDSVLIQLPAQLNDLTMNGNAIISGAMSNPIMTANIDLEPIQISKAGRIIISANATYNQNMARVDISGNGDAIRTLNGYAQMPMKISFNPFAFDMPSSTPIEGQLNLDAQAQSLARLILPVGHRLTGNIDVNTVIAGTVNAPDISGRMRFNNGTYMMNAYGVELFDIDMNGEFNRNSVIINSLSADDGRNGQLNGDGRISFANTQNTKLNLRLTDFKLLDSDKAEGNISADLNFVGRNTNYLLSGDVNLGEFNISIPERFQSNIPELNIVQKNDVGNEKQLLSDIELDVFVIADNRIFVRGWGLDAEFGGNINIDGTLDDPQLNGALESRRGRYKEFGRRFILERAYLRFQGTAPPSPYLDILATTDVDGIDASVNLTGEVGDPSISLSSVPALPEDEVMSHILFGENLTKITPFQAIQLKQTLDRFTGKGGGFDAIGKLRDITGLDDIYVDTNDEGETSVGVGKYLTEDVFLELEKGSGEQSGTAKIQVELAPNINLESEVGQDAEAGAGILWRWDY